MPAKKVTMRDIARAVGTSAVTVSKAMAGKPGMSAELRRKILKKAADMGYEYPHSGWLLPREHMEIGILIPDRYFEPDSFYAEIYKRLVKKLADQGHFGLLELLDPADEQALMLPSLITTKHVDGLIMLGEPSKPYYRKTAQAGTPVVFLDFYDEQANADAVAGDNAYGTYRLTSHLIRRGHREIGFVGNNKATGSIMDRFLGYYRAMLLNDLPVLYDHLTVGNAALCNLRVGHIVALLGARESNGVRQVLAADPYSESADSRIADHVREVIPGSEIVSAVTNVSGLTVGWQKTFAMFWADLSIVRDYNLLYKL